MLNEALKILRTENAGMTELIEKLKDGLIKYGQHRPDCAMSLYPESTSCTCGLLNLWLEVYNAEAPPENVLQPDGPSS